MSSLAIIARGRFGIEVADRLEQIVDATRAASPSEAFDSGAETVIVALEREDRTLLERCDEAAFMKSARLLPAVIEPGWLRCGPLIDPLAEGPCYHCFVVRRHQRWVEDDISDELHATPETAKGPADGYLPAHVELAARVLAGMSGRLTEPVGAPPGQVLECSLDRLEIRQGTLIGVAGCSRCASAHTISTAEFLRDVRLLRSHAGFHTS